MSQIANQAGSSSFTLLPALTITTAISIVPGTVIVPVLGAKYVIVQAAFVYGSGGTSADAYVQTSLDFGVTWIDVMNFHFTTASATKVSAVVSTTALAAAPALTDGSLASNTILSGLIGERLRVKYVTVGTYAGGTTLTLTGMAKG